MFCVVVSQPTARQAQGLLSGMSSAWEWLGISTSPASAVLVVVTGLLVFVASSFVEWLRALDTGCSGPGNQLLRASYLSTVERDTGSAGGFIEDPNSLTKLPLPTVFAPHEKSLSIILPAYNEAERLPLTLQDTLSYLKRRARVEKNFTYEILVVDDGSRDETASAAYGFSRTEGVDTVRVVKQPSNQGKGAAVRKGVLCARGALVLFADADAATRIADVEKLEEAIWKSVLLRQPPLPAPKLGAPATPPPKGTDPGAPGLTGKRLLEDLGAAAEDVGVAAFGSRAHLEKQALASRKWYRNILMYGFHVAVVLAGGSGVRDTQCGFKLFTRAAARQIFTNQRLKRWCFDVEILYLCKKLGIPIFEVAVTWTEVPGSKLRITSVLHMLLELAYIRIGYGLGIWRIKRTYNQS